ncbi:FecR domain-containing protein [uncultured Cohaesibacter sp.]|uniref:FecR domain-containing protein n=1 Tax=uncultured Cohaesibacter sp. TaxID=1002546 RepID=UPI0029C98A38|nr:FecR domain-containing protein [uncultured Cohaesibacter sp.]
MIHRIALILFLLLPSGAFAQTTASWTVEKVTGLAYIAEKGVPPIKVRHGSVLAPGQTLSTSDRTRLLLSRGKERIQVGPGTIMAIPPAKYIQPGKTLILQQSGQLQLSVNKKDVQHFAVKTPFLTAVVKGTTFTVDVAKNRSNVSVRNGRVEVSDGATGNTTEITRGQTASVTQNPAGKTQMNVTAAGAKPTVRTIRSRISKPNFYATVKVKDKVVALKPGARLETTTIDAVREAVTTAASSGSSNGSAASDNSAYASQDVSIDDDSDNDNSRSSENSSSSNSSSSSDTASSASPGNSNGAGNSENSNASNTATGSDTSSSSSDTSTSSTSPGNSNGAGNSENSNASDTATGSDTSSSSSDTSTSSTSPGNSNGAGNSENSNASDTALGNSN